MKRITLHWNDTHHLQCYFSRDKAGLSKILDLCLKLHHRTPVVPPQAHGAVWCRAELTLPALPCTRIPTLKLHGLLDLPMPTSFVSHSLPARFALPRDHGGKQPQRLSAEEQGRSFSSTLQLSWNSCSAPVSSLLWFTSHRLRLTWATADQLHLTHATCTGKGHQGVPLPPGKCVFYRTLRPRVYHGNGQRHVPSLQTGNRGTAALRWARERTASWLRWNETCTYRWFAFLISRTRKQQNTFALLPVPSSVFQANTYLGNF